MSKGKNQFSKETIEKFYNEFYKVRTYFLSNDADSWYSWQKLYYDSTDILTSLNANKKVYILSTKQESFINKYCQE